MMTLSPFKIALKKLENSIQSSLPRYRFVRIQDFKPIDAQVEQPQEPEGPFCSTCGTRISGGEENGYSTNHNANTCKLVNLALGELGASFDQMIRVEIYPNTGPLKGYYSPFQPFTIHVSEETYSLYPEYVIFHETKHLVDCLTKGWSEEETPDPFARDLCAKNGYRAPPPAPTNQQPWPQLGQQVRLNSTFGY